LSVVTPHCYYQQRLCRLVKAREPSSKPLVLQIFEGIECQNKLLSQHHIAAVFLNQIQELVVATGHHQIGDIYLGVVENVLPGIDAAFVNIGDTERNGFIHVTDLGPLKRTAAAILNC